MILSCCMGFFYMVAALAAPVHELDNFSFVIGEWEGIFTLHPSPRIPSETRVPAVMVSRWGPERAWIETESQMQSPAMGLYAVKVLVRFDPKEQIYDSFVMNTAGIAARYSGERTGKKLVFTGTIGNITQRVTYESLSDTEVSFIVEQSTDEMNFSPHSDVIWRRK